MSRARASLAMLVACAACAAPPPPAPDGDAALDPDASTSVDAPRVRPDGWSLEPYGECTTDAECAAGQTCFRSPFPRGLCSTRCDAASPCAPGIACVGGVCWPACSFRGSECRSDAMCVLSGPDAPAFCAPACDASGNDPGASCGEGTCSRRGDCVATPWLGAPLGATCTTDAECASRICLPIGHVCVASTRQPPDAEYLDATRPFPQGRCAAGEVVMPMYGTLGALLGATREGVRTLCVPSCARDADCRLGFRCERRGLGDAPEHATGGCVPHVCDSEVPGGPCGTAAAPGTCELFDGTLGLCHVAR